MHQLSESLQDMLATVKGRPITVADKAELLMLLSEAASLAKRYEEAPVGECVACDFEGYERPTWHVIDDRDAVPLTLRGRVRIVLDKEG